VIEVLEEKKVEENCIKMLGHIVKTATSVTCVLNGIR
jgi:hypothetical protein